MSDTQNISIVVDDGSRRVPILNARGEEIGAFTFHPTDIGIIQRFNDLVGRFDDILRPLEGIGDDASDDAVAAAFREAEARLCEAVNALFDSDQAADAFFGRMHPFSPVGGEFYCAQVLSAVGDYIGAAFETETAVFSEKARKYAKRAKRS